jgi:hypothetical protein
LHFVVLIEGLVEERLVDTVVSGDLEGPATLEITPSADGCIGALRWTLDPKSLSCADCLGQPSAVVVVP